VDVRAVVGTSCKAVAQVYKAIVERLHDQGSARLNSMDVIETLADLFVLRVVPAHIRSDQGPEFIAPAVKGSIATVGARTAYIKRGSPWENG
jgi:hypothetical protein